MPAKDAFHNAMRSALVKQGWTITHDPLYIEFEDVPLYVDLGAERLLAAVRGRDKIAVEVKSFLSDSAVSEFHAALGQFLNYRMALSELEPDRILYLAVPNDAVTIAFLLNDLLKKQLRLMIYG